jgi:hypothetical protein
MNTLLEGLGELLELVLQRVDLVDAVAQLIALLLSDSTLVPPFVDTLVLLEQDLVESLDLAAEKDSLHYGVNRYLILEVLDQFFLRSELLVRRFHFNVFVG